MMKEKTKKKATLVRKDRYIEDTAVLLSPVHMVP